MCKYCIFGFFYYYLHNFRYISNIFSMFYILLKNQLQPIATSYLTIFKKNPIWATGNQNYHKSGQPQLVCVCVCVVWLHSVAVQSGCSLFSVHATGPMNTTDTLNLQLAVGLPHQLILTSKFIVIETTKTITFVHSIPHKFSTPSYSLSSMDFVL